MNKLNRPQAVPVDDPAQSEAFLKTARELDADHDASKADALMGRAAKMKPEPRAKKKAPDAKKAEPGHSKSGTRSPN